ncbi:MAG: SpoIIE family protein phosphatase [Lachnospiraceae bacterium]|nr:SpoIIE family protein phosphatase [Lachnospiraceae bacterium]
MKKKTSIKQAIVSLIVVVSLLLSLVFLAVATVFFVSELTETYSDMEMAVTGACAEAVSPKELKQLAEACNEIYCSIEDPETEFETDRETYLSHFKEIQESDLYKKVWQTLNAERRPTGVTALDYVLIFPDQDVGIYIMDASDVNVLPCGELFTVQQPVYYTCQNLGIDLPGADSFYRKSLAIYGEEPGRDFDGFISYSTTYHEVWTDGRALYVEPAKGIYAYMMADIPVNEVQIRVVIYIVEVALVSALLTIIVCLFVSRSTQADIADPIREISSKADYFVESYELRADTRDETHIFEELKAEMLKVRELYELSRSLQSMELEMNSYLRDLDTMINDRARISTELDIATRIQTSMLPSVFPAFPDRQEFDLFASMKPAKEVGGDFYDFFLVDSDHLALVMADVSGKGIPAALFMTVSRSMIRNRTERGGSPGEILVDVNDSLCEQNMGDMFVTVWLGILTISTGEIVASSAGHEYPAIYGNDGRYALLKDKHGLACGAMKGVRYRDYTVSLPPGGRLFLYTDGVPEATDLQETLFGTDRMLEALNNGTAENPADTIEGVHEAVDRFVGQAEQFDDTTMLSLWYRGVTDQEDGGKRMKELRIEAKVDNLAAVQDFVGAFLEEKGCGMKTQLTIDVAVEEIFVNIASYAYGDSVGDALIRVEEAEGGAAITFIDSGVPYDPLAKEDPDITLSAAERQIGGLGIFMVKKSMDDMRYERRDNHNILTIVKKF